jgi:hypothetical protein
MSASSTKAIRDLLIWARKEKIVLSSVTIGNATITVERDYQLQPPAGSQPVQERKQTIYEQFAGSLLRPAESAPTGNEPTEEDE